MRFEHIHCSSRFSRSEASLETATDAWRQKCDVLTMTEVGDSGRRRALAEKGWGLFQVTGGETGRAECATMWDNQVWTKQWGQAIRLIGRWPTSHGGTLWAVYANTVILKHNVSGHRVLFTTIHTPNKIGGASGFKPQLAAGEARIASYKRCMINWDNAIAKIMKTKKPDAIVISADFNVNFRLAWFPRYLKNQFKDLGVAVSWKQFTSKGTFGHGVIDGSLYAGLTTDGSYVIADVDDSTDHTPFKTVYTTLHAPGKVSSGTTDTGDATDTSPEGDAWWNFDDYGDDTIYQIEQL